MKSVSRELIVLLLVGFVSGHALADTLTASARLTIASNIVSGTAEDTLVHSVAARLANGTDTQQINAVWHGTITLAPSASYSVDLIGSLTNALGQAAQFKVVRGILVENTGARSVTVGGSATAFSAGLDPATATLTLQASASVLLLTPAAGLTATDTESDIITLTNPDAAATASAFLWLVGASE